MGLSALVVVTACGQQTSGPLSEASAGVGCGDPDGLLGVFHATTELSGPATDYEHRLDVWALDADGAVTRATDDGSSFDPSMSDDGARIYFSRTPGGIGDIGAPPPSEAWVLDRATGVQTLLFEAPNVRAVRESPRGDRVAYLSFVDGANRLFVTDLSGGEPTALPAPPRPGFYQAQRDPEWSPDGSRVAYIATATTTPDLYEAVHVVDLRTGAHTVLYSAKEGVSLIGLDWPGEGNDLVVTESNGLAGTAFAVDVKTNEIRTLAESVYNPVAAAAANLSVLVEFGIPSEQAQTPAGQPVLRILRGADNVKTLDLSVRFENNNAGKLMIPDCALIESQGDSR